MQDQTPSPEHSDEMQPYESPTLEALGSVTTLTGGPAGGTIDLLVGGTGGFDPGSTS